MLLQVQPAWQDGRTHLEILFIIEWASIELFHTQGLLAIPIAGAGQGGQWDWAMHTFELWLL